MGVCGCGADPRANGTSPDFFRLIPDLARVQVVIPDTFEEVVMETGRRRRVVASCEGNQNQTFHYDGIGVWVSFAMFTHFVQPNGFVRNQMMFSLETDAAWRDRAAVDLTAFILANHATTVLAVIDMDSGALLNANQGTHTVRENMVEVIRLAQASNMRIFEVYCAGHPTHQSLRDAIRIRADGHAYAHYRVFEKPGAGGSCDDACLEVNVLPATRFSAAIGPFANVIVMGFDGAICVGKSVFGGWRTNRVIAVGQDIDVHTIDEYYERGILDHGKNVITSWKVIICGNAGGPMVDGYLRYRDG